MSDLTISEYLNNLSLINDDLDESIKIAILQKNPMLLKVFKKQTIIMAYTAVELDLNTYKYVDKTIITPTFLEDIVKVHPYLITEIYSPSEDLIAIALYLQPSLIQFVFAGKKTRFPQIAEDCLVYVVECDGMYLEYIPAELQTERIINAAYKENNFSYNYSDIEVSAVEADILAKNLDDQIVVDKSDITNIDLLLADDPRNIRNFLNKLTTDKELIKQLISRDPNIYRMLIDPTDDIKRFTLDCDYRMIRFMLSPYNTELVDYAISRNGLALEYVRKKDLDIIRRCIDRNAESLKFVEYPRQFLIDYAFAQDGIALQFIREPNQDDYFSGASRNGKAIAFVPNESQTDIMQLNALRQSGIAAAKLISIPKSKEVIDEMLSIYPYSLFNMETITDEMVEIAASKVGKIIMFFENWENVFSERIKCAAIINDPTIYKSLVNPNIWLELASLGVDPYEYTLLDTSTIEKKESPNPSNTYIIKSFNQLKSEDLLFLEPQITKFEVAKMLKLVMLPFDYYYVQNDMHYTYKVNDLFPIRKLGNYYMYYEEKRRMLILLDEEHKTYARKLNGEIIAFDELYLEPLKAMDMNTKYEILNVTTHSNVSTMLFERDNDKFMFNDKVIHPFTNVNVVAQIELGTHLIYNKITPFMNKLILHRRSRRSVEILFERQKEYGHILFNEPLSGLKYDYVDGYTLSANEVLKMNHIIYDEQNKKFFKYKGENRIGGYKINLNKIALSEKEYIDITFVDFIIDTNFDLTVFNIRHNEFVRIEIIQGVKTQLPTGELKLKDIKTVSDIYVEDSTKKISLNLDATLFETVQFHISKYSIVDKFMDDKISTLTLDITDFASLTTYDNVALVPAIDFYVKDPVITINDIQNILTIGEKGLLVYETDIWKGVIEFEYYGGDMIQMPLSLMYFEEKYKTSFK